ncbi:hypothetical protein AArcSl_1659 [Halalkaliarchaeum desulfuricum]|uniref:Uncharacterized protein n=1 Tax=Halalkaliarchaeum desulfuricum TaxID=2055893 RepID=A0A343TJL6_9EURY|nr:hypothetical protein [Halalkaliarchaeum desulfuricum]AUX09288.1 hypothetical protein AArcSl_1659 [Halalkaliarchaeum desulfuricum]
MKRLVLTALVVLVLVGIPAAAAVDDVQSAELEIDQPHYIDDRIVTDDSGTVTLYEASGPELLLTLENVNGSVVDYGVEEDGGALKRHPDLDAWVFEAEADATYSLWWAVEETQVIEEDNETTTETVETRYEARLRVDQTSMQHYETGVVEDIREDAQSWQNWEDAVQSERIAGTDADIEEETDAALGLLRLRHNPIEALTGDFTSLLLTLFITLSGLVIVAMAVGAHLWSRRQDIIEQRRRRKLDAERADLEEQLDAMEAHERQAALEGLDWNDIFPDDVARAFRETLGETVLDGWLTIQPALDPEYLLRDRLRAMSDTHVAVREPVSDGGGESESDRTFEWASWRLEPRGSRPENRASEVRELDDPDQDVIEGISLDDPELVAFDLSEHADRDFEIEVDVDELVSRLDIDLRRDFDEDPELVAKYLTEFLQSVLDHDYTDRDGRVRPVRHALNLWLRALRHIGEREGVPTARYQAQHVEMLLRTYDREEEIADWVDRVELGQVQE